MSAAVAHRLFETVPVPERPRLTVVPALRDPSLDALLAGTWSALGAGRAVACPICAGHMAPRPTASGENAGGRCRDCGTSFD